MNNSTIRVGVVGVGRGKSFAESAGKLTGMKLVAVCDIWEERLKQLASEYSVVAYTDYDQFLSHDMDAIILANYFNEHAPFAIKALRSGKHVMSETSSNATIGEGVALCRTVEETGLIYMLAENYPYTVFNQEMHRLYREGEIGEVTYAEGEYNHPMSKDDSLRLSPGINHWRSWIPSTYYCTHALAPLVYITDTRPVSVNALSIARPDRSPTLRRGDPGFVILCRMDNGAVFRLFGLSLPGHSNWYRLHGESGAMETTRGPGYFGPEEIRVWHEPWHSPSGKHKETVYKPDWPEHGDLANSTGHGGGDFWTSFHFGEAIRSGKQPFLDVYSSVAISSVGILGWKSALEDGHPFEVPNFRDENNRKCWENDEWSPWPAAAGTGQPPPSILGIREPKQEDLIYAQNIWKDMGDEG